MTDTDKVAAENYLEIGNRFPYRKNSFQSSAAENRGLWEGVVQEPLRKALFCSFSVFWGDFLLQISQKFLSEIAPLQCRHFLENPLAKNPKTQLLKSLFGNFPC